MKVDKDDNSGAGSAGDEKAPPSGAGPENPDGKRRADPKADVNGERPLWYGIEVSIVNSATETETKSVTIGSVLEDIRNGRWKIPVGRIREKYSTEFAKAVKEGDPDPAATAKKAVNGAKKNLPGILWSGKFSGQANDKLEVHSGVLGLDHDNLGERLEPLRQKLKSDKRVQAFFRSPTGSGLKVLLRIQADGKTHRRSFEAARKYMRDTYNEEVDELCKNVSRICFVCHDPDIFIRAEDTVLLEPLPATSNGDEMKRPGVSEAFLRAQGVRHVEVEEAEGLLGFRPSGRGVWIPYFGFNAPGPLIVDDRAYGRLRLDEPTRDAKYLSPKDSGAQLYVPAMCGSFERELVICEGEFKALSLCEAGIRAVAVGGISCAMTEGRLITDLEKLFSKFPAIGRVYFLGDADTALNFEFSREAVKLAGALPDGVELRLPRIPFGGPNGIDDRRAEFGGEFAMFWAGIKENTVEVPVKSDASTIAAELLVLVLPAIGKLPDGQKKYLKKIKALAGRLGPIAFDEVAKAVKEHLGINRESFKDEVAKTRGAQAAAFTPCDAKEAEIVAKYGAPYSKGQYGEVLTNEKFFAAAFTLKHRVLFEVTEGRFYLYNAGSGAWRYTNVTLVKGMISNDWHEFARRENLKELDRRGSSGCVNAIFDLLRGYVAREGAFKPLYAMLHCANGMLEITESKTKLHPFSPEYYSRNPIPVAWNPEAKCPEFMDVLINPAMGADDADLLVRHGGSVLLGINYAQRFMMLEGTAGGGKGTYVEVLEAIIGEGNSVQMRTALLEERFEVGRYVGKTLLAGKDVAGDFLEERGASMIKCLVGNDKLTGEIKGSMETPSIKGIFGMIITCNSSLRVRLDGDVEAWRRRMLLIRYERPKPVRRIAGYSEKLLEAEAEGILVLFVGGAMKHLGELRELGDFSLTKEQQERVDVLLSESDSVRHFAEERIYAVESGVLPIADIVGAYFKFCGEVGWNPLPLGRVYRELPGIMMELFGSNAGAHGKSEEGERVRGYPKVALRQSGYTRADIQL